MENNLWKYILNQNYLIRFDESIVQIYEIMSIDKINLSFEFETKGLISSIQFNPLLDNIIIISFTDGTCKIYNLLKKSGKEEILFECIKKENIKLSLFNIFDPNVIATLTKKNDLYIWDIRNLYYSNIMNINMSINRIKWSHYDKDYI